LAESSSPAAAPVTPVTTRAVRAKSSLPPSHQRDRGKCKMRSESWKYGGRRPKYTSPLKKITGQTILHDLVWTFLSNPVKQRLFYSSLVFTRSDRDTLIPFPSLPPPLAHHRRRCNISARSVTEAPEARRHCSLPPCTTTLVGAPAARPWRRNSSAHCVASNRRSSPALLATPNA
jgi:hypothetical protein